jgi:membrane-bound lytic murein transglycosylase
VLRLVGLLLLLISGYALTAQPRPAPLAVDDPKVKQCLEGTTPRPPSPPPGPNPGPTPKPPSPVRPIKYYLANPSDLPLNKPEGNIEDFKLVLRRQIQKCERDFVNLASSTNPDHAALKADYSFEFGCHRITRKDWCLKVNNRMLELANEVKTSDWATLTVDQRNTRFGGLMNKIKDEFAWYEVAREKNPNPKLNIPEMEATGYNNHRLDLSNVPTEEYNYPIYQVPENWIRVREGDKRVWYKVNPDKSRTPMAAPTRAEIDAGAIDKKYIVGWAKGALDVTYMQTEGSGLATFPDGSKMQFNYQQQNGYENHVVSKLMKCRGLGHLGQPEKIREYFKDKPEELTKTLALNPSYVFYKPTKLGPMGSGGTELVAFHSMATDNTVIPNAVTAWMSSQRPNENVGAKPIEFNTLLTSQDIGGKIKGMHIDHYWGTGDYADIAAKRMGGMGQLFIPVPKDAQLTSACQVAKPQQPPPTVVPASFSSGFIK